MRQTEQAFGLDRPMPVQYLSWLGSFLTLDWGYSFSSHQPVLQLIGERLPNTLYLMGTVFVVVLVLAIPIGVMTALKQYSIFDHVVTGVHVRVREWHGPFVVLVLRVGNFGERVERFRSELVAERIFRMAGVPCPILRRVAVDNER